MDGNRDFAQLPVFPPGHKKDVKALSQIFPLSFEASGPELQAKCRNLPNACSDHLTFAGRFSHLGMETLSRTLLPEQQPEAFISTPCRLSNLQNFSSSQVDVNNWLTVTNWVPPVNDAHGH